VNALSLELANGACDYAGEQMEAARMPRPAIAGAVEASGAGEPSEAVPDALRGYPGAKGGEGVYHRIISLMPPHDMYIEPFVGSGAILRFKRPALHSIAIDADPMVIGYWKVRRAEIEELASTSFICGDGIRWLENFPWQGGELVYADPPYLMSTLSCQRDYYRAEFSEADHVRLLAVLKKLPCPVLLSGYWSPLYDDALQGWPLTTFRVMTHGGPATECLWRNFAAPLALHDYRYLGDGFRERERIKRKKQRWQKRLAEMSPLERAAVIAAVDEMRGE
jgi:hypothetical protein